MEKCINKQIKLVSKLSKLTFRYCVDDFSGKKFEWIFFLTSTNRTVKIRRRSAKGKCELRHQYGCIPGSPKARLPDETQERCPWCNAQCSAQVQRTKRLAWKWPGFHVPTSGIANFMITGPVKWFIMVKIRVRKVRKHTSSAVPVFIWVR
jgi:hypothetical protein